MAAHPEKFSQFPVSVIFGQSNPNLASEDSLCQIKEQIATVEQRDLVIKKIEDYVEQVTLGGLSYDVLLVSGELINNALLNAPVGDINNLKSGVERDSSKIKIDPSKQPILFASSDESRVVVGCKDFYGSLNVGKLIEKIHSCYTKDLGESINFDKGGSGIGAFMSFNSCNAFYVSVIPGHSTTICCSFLRKKSRVARSQTPKNLHIITCGAL